MNLFETDDYKQFVMFRVKAMPKKGRGQLLKMARHLKMHSTMVSHIFRGEKHLTPEQAFRLCEFLGLTEIEQKFFLFFQSH